MLPEESTLLAAERNIARCRVVLSAVAFVAIWVDPTHPTLTRWLPLTGGTFVIDPKALAALALYAVYAAATWAWVARSPRVPPHLAAFTVTADIALAVLIALPTEGATSPYYVFLSFPILAVGFRSGLRAALQVTALGAVLYLGLMLVSAPRNASLYIMRPAYLGITGYLVGFFGQQRQEREERIHELEAARQRERIARSLHDGYAQALASVNIRLENSRELLRRGRVEDAIDEIEELQGGVRREYDDLRAYIRSLTNRTLTPAPAGTTPAAATTFRVHADFAGGYDVVEHALSILLEGTRNVHRHAKARSATLTASRQAGEVRITIEDDGVGFGPASGPPWSIASRAAESAGRVEMNDRSPGAHLSVILPVA